MKGKAIMYGDDINTDLIIPGRYLHITDPYELAKHTMEGIDREFFKRFKKCDIIVAGKNFGCGSSREQAAICLKYAGVTSIIAKSFARIFYRNAINRGIQIIESLEAVDGIDDGDELELDFKGRRIKNVTKNLEFEIESFPQFLQEIIDNGGLINNIRKRLEK